MPKARHSQEAVMRAATLFFAVRGVVRTSLAQGRRLDPYAWLRIETMVYIRDNAGAPMKDIAAFLSITAPSATSLMAPLVRKGYVERRADPADRRAVKVYLTKKGQKKLAKAVSHGMQALASVFAPLSSADLAAFTKLLERIKADGEVVSP